MTKYEPWRSLLQTLGADEIVVTFEQLGEVAPLPKAAHTRDAGQARVCPRSSARRCCGNWCSRPAALSSIASMSKAVAPTSLRPSTS